MRSEDLRTVLAEYEEQRRRNDEENARRLAEAVARCPEIGEAVRAREELIFGGIRGILDGKAGEGELSAGMEQANRRIAELLTANGFAPDYLEPVCRCPVCKDTGYVGYPVREMCACLKERLYRRQTGGPQAVSGETFETWDETLYGTESDPRYGQSPRRVAALACRACRDWAERYPDADTPDLLLMGGSGLGKTFLLHAMLDVLLKRQVDALFISAYDLMEAFRKDFFDKGDGGSELYGSVPVLMIDDLGGEPVLRNITVEHLLHLIDTRRARGLSTVISTNLDEKSLQDTYTERVVSRLLDLRRVRKVQLIGEDIRRRRAAT